MSCFSTFVLGFAYCSLVLAVLEFRHILSCAKSKSTYKNWYRGQLEMSNMKVSNMCIYIYIYIYIGTLYRANKEEYEGIFFWGNLYRT